MENFHEEKEEKTKHTRLGLSNNIMPLYTWYNSTLLYSRRLFKTISIDASQQLLLQVHIIKIVDNL